MPKAFAIAGCRLRIQALLGRNSIALNPGGKKRYITLCVIRFYFGGHEYEVPAGYEFDGPSVPRLLWWIAGLSPADVDTLFASCIHDWGTENPLEIPRDMADAMFRIALGPHTINDELQPGVGRLRRNAMYIGVRYWSHKSGATN
jgi:Protein of unknown function (DUF1353)